MSRARCRRLIFLDLAISGKFPDSPDAHGGGADMIMVEQQTNLICIPFLDSYYMGLLYNDLIISVPFINYSYTLSLFVGFSELFLFHQQIGISIFGRWNWFRFLQHFYKWSTTVPISVHCGWKTTRPIALAAGCSWGHSCRTLMTVWMMLHNTAAILIPWHFYSGYTTTALPHKRFCCR